MALLEAPPHPVHAHGREEVHPAPCSRLVALTRPSVARAPRRPHSGRQHEALALVVRHGGLLPVPHARCSWTHTASTPSSLSPLPLLSTVRTLPSRRPCRCSGHGPRPPGSHRRQLPFSGRCLQGFDMENPTALRKARYTEVMYSRATSELPGLSFAHSPHNLSLCQS